MTKPKLLIFITVLGIFLPLSFARAFVILSAHRFAWSDRVGYINFENVTVEDGALGGFAWSANKGFIKFNPAQGGVFNDGTGNLSGSAWGEQLGWIDFNGVSISGTTGKFSGTATSPTVGTITFDCLNCDVQTDWRQTTPPTNPPPSGGGVSAGSGGSTVGEVLLPNTGVTQVNPNIVISPGIPETELANEAKSAQAAVVTSGTSGQLSQGTSLVNPPSPPIVPGPVQPAPPGPSRFKLDVFSLIVGILLTLLILFVIRLFIK